VRSDYDTDNGKKFPNLIYYIFRALIRCIKRIKDD